MTVAAAVITADKVEEEVRVIAAVCDMVVDSITDAICADTGNAGGTVEGAWSTNDIDDDSTNALKVTYWFASEIGTYR